MFKDIPDVEKLILQTVEHRSADDCLRLYSKPSDIDCASLCVCMCLYSKCGWDHVVEGVVMLGFNLMDSCAPKTSSECST